MCIFSKRRESTRSTDLWDDRKSQILVRRWILQILFDFSAVHSFIDRDLGILNDRIGQFLGLDDFVNHYKKENYPRLLDTLRKQKETLESRPPVYLKLLRKNLKKLTKLIPLNKTVREILAFSLYLQFSEPLDDTVRFLGDIGGSRIHRFLSRLLPRPIKKVKAALAPESALMHSGLLRLDRGREGALRNKLELFDEEFAHNMLCEDIPIEAMIRERVRPAPAGTLTMEDYDHMDKDLKPVYQAVSKEAAQAGLDRLEEKWGSKHPTVLRSWRNKWENLSNDFKYPADIRRIVYTTNIIESVHRQFRKLTKTKEAFPNENSLLKLLYLGIENAQKKWTMPIQNWNLTLSQLAIFFEGRLDDALDL